jgi:hypothetical protein
VLKRSEIVALSKAALQRVMSGKAGAIPPNEKHIKRLAELKQEKRKQDAEAAQSQKRLAPRIMT